MVQVYVATGTQIPFAIPEYCVPVEAGSYFREEHLEGYIRDDDGENISVKNHEYCELSVLYWAWKNSKADIKGLCHYRRFFHKSEQVYVFQNEYVNGKDLLSKSPTEHQIDSMLQTADIIMPIPYHPYPRTVLEDLQIYVYPKDIQIMEHVLEENYPDYYKTYCDIRSRQRIPYCNMMIASAEVYDAYCAWLFPLLNRVSEDVDMSGYDTQHKRIYGYLSEVLLSVWVETKGLRKTYLNLAQVWDVWKKPENMPDLTVIGETIHAIESVPVLSTLYHCYSSVRYPEVYKGFRDVKQLVEEQKRS